MGSPHRTLALLGVLLVAPVLPPSARADCPSGAYFGTPGPVTTGANPLFPVFADLDADGILDLVVTNSNYQGGGVARVAVLRGTGGGAFAAPTVYGVGTQPHGVVVADFDEDGALDLAVANKVSGTLSVLRGNKTAGVPDGTFSPAVTYAVGAGPFQLVAGDYDEDGILDLAIALNDIARVAVLRGLGVGGVGNGAFAPPVNYTLANRSVAIAQGDFDGDGILDLVATEYTNGTVAFLRGLGTGGVGDGTFAPATHFVAGPEPFDLEVFDFDADGALDLAVANGSNGGVRVLRGAGNGTFALVNALPSGNNSSVLALDVDQDGILDLVAGETTASVGKRLRVYRGLGAGGIGTGGYVEATPIELPGDPYQLAAAELTGDGIPDLLATQYNTNDVVRLNGGCAAAAPDPRFPVLTDVRDVPADQGGRVYLTWLRSSLDVANGSVNSYRVWRRIPALADGAAPVEAARARGTVTTRSERGPDGALLVTYWESIANLPAQRLEGYGYTAPTTEDSTKQNPVSTAFFVSALTSNIDVSYPSNVDSAGSIDNLAPDAPANLRADGGGSGFRLAWSAPAAPDLAGYRVYRGPSAQFALEEAAFLGTVADTAYEDVGAPVGAWYRVTAVDVHNNEGPPSGALAGGGAAVGAGVPPRLALAGARPHPARAGTVRLGFSLATDAPARLEVFDVNGRRIAAPSLAGRGAGEHVVDLAGRGVRFAPGVYWVRLTQGAESRERKIVVSD